MRHILFAFLLAGLLVVQAVSADEPVKVLRLDYLIVRESPDSSGRIVRDVFTQTRYVAPDGRQRIEDIEQRLSRREALLIDRTARTVTRLDLNKKTARRDAQAAGKMGITCCDSTSPAVAAQNGTGRKEVIQGFQCTATSQGDPARPAFEAASCLDPASGKRFIGRLVHRFPDGKLWQQELQSVTRDLPVDPQMFQVPADFRRID